MIPEMIPETNGFRSWRLWRSLALMLPFFAVFLWALVLLLVSQLAWPAFLGWVVAIAIAFYVADRAETLITAVCLGEKLERVPTEEGVYQLYWRKLR